MINHPNPLLTWSSFLISPEMSSSQSLRPLAALEAKFDDKPLWNHVKVVGSYTKVKGHLLRLTHHNVEGCMAISDDVLEAIKKEHETTEAKKAQQALNARKKADYVSIPEGSDLLQQKKCKGMASGGDQFDIEGQKVGELAQLSLDEP
ncbi:hypothetical protein Vadar_034479 [Vaccinium darrowii]|uniref:Uncharacterized protein n=1 Tax=Vaccinium darrowii TaxID=229202 RepID=A0ACB7X6J3_9ERIC|nr:hypothetical protein Vadar_034479 [Vaccinium darrowii]